MSTIIQDHIRKQFHPKLPSVAEFAESTDYCGKTLYPLQRVLLKTIFLEELDGWEEDLLNWMLRGGRGGEIRVSPDFRKRVDICRARGYAHFSEVDFVGGRRSSKGYLSGLAGAYKLYGVQQLPDPGSYYNIDPDKVLDFICVAASFDQAKTLQFADLRASITNCKPMIPYIGKDLEEVLTIKTDSDADTIRALKSMGIKVARDFAKIRVRPMAANSDTIRGTASLLLIFDEMAFMMPGESRQSAQQVYAAAEPSLAQFGHHALVFCNSSPYTKVGQFFDQVDLSMRPEQHKDGWYPNRFSMTFPSWALFDQWWKDPQSRWRNAIMVSPDWPDVLDADNPHSNLDQLSLGKREEEGLKEKANPDTYKVERRAQWAEVLDAYLDPAMVDMAFSGVLPNGDVHYASYGGTYKHDYKAHCDPSSTTAGFGFALAHVEEFPDPTGIFPDGIARHVVFDFVKRWNPADFPGHTINYLKVREELAYWLDIFRPSALTFDQYNSVGLIQELRDDARKMNHPSVHIGEVKATAAINWNRWEAFKTALNLGLVHMPPGCVDKATGFDHSEYAALELKFLQEVQSGQTKRVDKQELGPIQTKDIADCIAEVTIKFLGSYLGDFMSKNLREAQVEYGSEGGYQIGGRSPLGPGEPRGGERFTGYGGKQIDLQRARGFSGRDAQRGRRRY